MKMPKKVLSRIRDSVTNVANMNIANKSLNVHRSYVLDWEANQNCINREIKNILKLEKACHHSFKNLVLLSALKKVELKSRKL
jgi:hypothetical protein